MALEGKKVSLREVKRRYYYFIKRKLHRGYALDPFSILSKLNRLQWLAKEELEERAFNKLRVLLSHADRNVPLYAKRFKASGIKPEDVKGIRDLARIPIIGKYELKNNFSEAIAGNVPGYRRFLGRTSGSTGEPFQFYQDTYAGPMNLASFWLFNSWFGVKPLSKYVRISSPQYPSGTYVKPSFSSLSFDGLVRTMLNLGPLYPKYHISALEVTPENTLSIVSKINEYRPQYFEGYVSALVLLAIYMRRYGLSFEFKPKGVMTTSETLAEAQRTQIESVFSCSVFNTYGLLEVGGIVAQECSAREGLHINSDLVLVEVVDQNGELCSLGEGGRMIITDLNNFVMPFIRYDTGDVGVQGDFCSCGRGFPLIKRIQGREADYVETASGDRIPLVSISHPLFAVFGFSHYIDEFQYVQRKKGKITLKVVPRESYTPHVETAIQNSIRKLLESIEIDVDIKVVERIQPLRSGKRPILVKE